MREIVLDTETTGLKFSDNHRVIEVAAIEIVDYLPTGNVFHKYVNPQRDVPESSVDIHGITEKFLENKPLFKEIADEFLEFISVDNIVAHNAPFDIGFLNFELQRCGKNTLSNKAIDTVVLAREKFPGQSVSLDALCKRLSIDNTLREKHSATLDAELLARVYIELNDAREPSLNLAIDVEDHLIDTDFDISLLQERNLKIQITSEEERLHSEFINTLGKDAIWHKIKND
ncbi:MAG: DNA polymerase III subunit epsilon [Candidatus Pelagibacterales bacterium]|jgi:DNA polymerase-3 subunit epsilon|nr:DNA polymerase III subunit epsilon [Pelagibacterales bacterium]MDB4220190.1 DNA polymerase III subunit epsilon [Pelagibacterales bacterium]|tara:strand:+ start:1673 stop:2362 length:690 start_codon:yes stop_codon:yes gene_type:complete